MYTLLPRVTVGLIVGMVGPFVASPAQAQGFEVLGTRAAGMGGAFVAVADDATAVYWNPAGLVLGGSYFSLVIDTSQGKAEPEDTPRAGSRSASIIAVSTPPLGLSYYRLAATTLKPVADPSGRPTVRLERLVTHHAGVTVVQSLANRLAVATTLKLVRGVAAAGLVADGDRDDLLNDAGDLPGAANSKFDVDIGVRASLGTLRAGLTVRNAREPDFATAGGESLELERQTRAGICYVGVQGLILSADVDVERAVGSLGEVRNLAAGAEARIMPRAFVRSGFRFNTLADQPGGRALVYSVGGSYATLRSLVIDAQVTLGADAGDRGWGVAARLVY